MTNKFRSQSGLVMILAILIIGAVLGSALTFGNLIIREIQQNRLIDQSIQSYYFAESGAEQALYQLRQRQAVIADDCGKLFVNPACNDINGYCDGSSASSKISCITENHLPINPIGNFEVTAENEMETSVYLKVGESLQLDLFSPYLMNYQSQIQSVLIRSDVASGSMLYSEITNLTKLLGGSASCPVIQTVPPQPAIVKDRISLAPENPPTGFSTSGYFTGFAAEPFNPNCSYIFRLSNNDLVNAPGWSGQYSVKLYSKAVFDPSDDPEDFLVPIPSRLVITSKAVFGQTQQTVVVRTPMRAPVSGLYDFVMFSEADIVK